MADIASDYQTAFRGLASADRINEALENFEEEPVFSSGNSTEGTGKVNLFDELEDSGVKYNPENVVMITKNSEGKLMWLENGNSKAGLTHILERHTNDFASQGADDVPKLLNGNTYRVAYGTNGFIVSFYPID